MQTKEYIVALQDGIDYDQFWLDMESDTQGLPHIPNRAISITNERRAFKRICEYALTDDEADRVKNDPRVLAVEIPVRNNPLVTMEYDTVQDKNFNKTIVSTGDQVNWGLIRHGYPTNVYGTTADTYKTTVKKYDYTVDGSRVDIVICDTGLQVDHPEFRGRVLNVNWDLYAPTGSGGGLNDISREDTNGHGTHVAGIAAGTTYGWAKGANIIPLKNYYNDMDNNGEPLDIFETLINWHRSKNGSRPTVMNMSWELRLNFPNSLLSRDPKTPRLKSVDYRQCITGGMYRNTPIVPGTGVDYDAVNDVDNITKTVDKEYYKSIGLIDIIQGLPLQDTGTTPVLGYLPFTSLAYNAALAEVIDAGIVVVQAAGNNNFKMDKPDSDGGSGDYNNYVNISIPQYSYTGSLYYHRGSSPRDPRAIVVGNLYDGLAQGQVWKAGQEWKSPDSTKGPRIDVWAAGSNILSTCSNTNRLGLGGTQAAMGDYPHGTDSEKTIYKQLLLTGTSMASPQIAGMCALYLQKFPKATVEEVKAWIKNNSVKGLLQDSANGSTTAYADRYSLLGSDTGIAYQNLQSISKSYVKDASGVWQQTRAIWVKHSDGTWKKAKAGWKKNSLGQWEKIYQN
jgi:subtilisin family serine protease